MRTSEIVQWIKALAAKLTDPSSIPGTHMGGENHLQVAL